MAAIRPPRSITPCNKDGIIIVIFAAQCDWLISKLWMFNEWNKIFGSRNKLSKFGAVE